MPSPSLQNGFLVEGSPKSACWARNTQTSYQLSDACSDVSSTTTTVVCACVLVFLKATDVTDILTLIITYCDIWRSLFLHPSCTDCNDLRCGHKEKPTCHSSDPTLPYIIHHNTGANTFKPAPTYLCCSSTLTACAGPHPLFDLNEENNNLPDLCVLHWVTKRINKI